MKKRVLLVEDHPVNIAVIQHELVFLGYEVIVAKDGVEAVEMASSNLPDLIVMDICMPKMDGLEAVSRIRKNAKTSKIPILAATAKDIPGDKEHCLASGCDDYMSKPFSYKDLDTVLKNLLEKRSEMT